MTFYGAPLFPAIEVPDLVVETARGGDPKLAMDLLAEHCFPVTPLDSGDEAIQKTWQRVKGVLFNPDIPGPLKMDLDVRFQEYLTANPPKK